MIRHFSEDDVAAQLTMPAALRAVRDSFERVADGHVHEEPRIRLHTPGGYFAAICAIDEQLALSSVKSYTVVDGELRGFVISLSSIADGSPQAVIEADHLTKMRTGAASGVAAASLARTGATTVGIIGCGRQAPFQLDAVRQALPQLTHALAWCRSRRSLEAFCAKTGASPASSAEEAVRCDIVLAATTSPTPVVNGAWLRPGALVIAIGGDHHGDRELDDDAIRRAALVVCDSIATSRVEAADIWAPVESGILAWDAVIELQDIMACKHPGRRSADDIVLFKSNGLAAWDLAVAGALVTSPPRERHNPPG